MFACLNLTSSIEIKDIIKTHYYIIIIINFKVK